MLSTRFRRPRRRRGMTIVESALVLSVFLLLLFGMFEYCRFLLVLHVSNNAAREGARYAVVNLDKPSDFDYNDYVDANGTRYTNIQDYTKARLSGVKNTLETPAAYTSQGPSAIVACYAVDPSGLAQTPPLVQPKKKAAVVPDPFIKNDPNRVPWNSAVFTEKIAVTVYGVYRPVLPTFLFMPQTIDVKVTALMGSEG
ncbi:MAG: pilus assembly protein [Planctomycetes bacterium]|nr:pilus assembly protein [Planctomycetota bacterium]